MILRFSVRNYRSIGEKQEISMIASKLDDDLKSNLINIKNNKFKVLPSAVIYGANASGKSNLLKAMQFFQKGILRSHTYSGEDKVKFPKFLLEGIEDTESATFEMDFLLPVGDEKATSATNSPDEDLESEEVTFIRMTYGFTLSESGIREEWLYSYPKQYKQILFHRNSEEKQVFYFGPSLKGHNKIISENTKAQSLFLSTANANNHPQLKEIYRFFRRSMHFSLNNDGDINEEQTSIFLEDDGLRKLILGLIGSADVGVCEAKVEVIKRPEEFNSMATELKEILNKYIPNENILKEVDKNERKKIQLGHKTEGGVVFLDLHDESRGTVAFLNIIGWAIIAVNTGSTLIVDELDSSLHPLLCRKIVQMFNNPEINQSGAQLLFTTHDTTLLSNDLVRRDQVWFSEKDHRGSSHYYPLSDMKIRKSDNFERGYLDGRFGAIPYLGEFSLLN